MMNVRPIKKSMVENEVTKKANSSSDHKSFIVSLFLFGSVSIHMNRYTHTQSHTT